MNGLAPRRVRGVIFGAVAGLPFLLFACASGPQSRPSPAGVVSASLLDTDGSSGRYALYRRTSDGSWYFGGGADAFADRAEIRLDLAVEDRERIAALMEDAGWFEPSYQPAPGPGPRRLEVVLLTVERRSRFTVSAEGRTFPSPIDELIATLKSVAERRFSSVINELPKGRGDG